MAVLLPGKFLYLGTPRCGSSAVHDALKNVPEVKLFHQHITVPEIKRVHSGLGPELRMATVRNPYDLVVTWWLRARRNDRVTLLEFVRDFQHRLFERDGRLFYLCTDDVEILRYETLQEDLDRNLAKAGVRPVVLDRVNVTEGKRDWRSYYGPEEIAAVEERFGHEMDRYGYERLSSDLG